ncbi:MAG: hypothetical protein KC422_10880 [Trueperaceae bacterium]|nr:hypothetical protein [Trueperaceae bacterium]
MKKLVYLISILVNFGLVLAQSSVTQGEGPALNVNNLSSIYQETFEGDPETMMQGALTFGQDGSWTGSLNNGAYLMENQNDATAVRYFYLGTSEGNAASVEVAAQYGSFSGAGLIYRFDVTTGNYFAFILSGPNSYALLKRNGDGLALMIEGSSAAIGQGANRLSIVDDAGEMKLYINETFVASVSDNEVVGNRAGLIAVGSGLFQLDNFSIYNYTQTQNTAPENPLAPKSSKVETTVATNQTTTAWTTQAPQQAMVLYYESTYKSDSETTIENLEFSITPQANGLWEVVRKAGDGSTETYYANAEGQLFENGQALDKSLFYYSAALWNFGESFFSQDMFSLEESEDAWFYSLNQEDLQLRSLYDKVNGILLEEQFCNTEFCETTRLLGMEEIDTSLASRF